MIPDAYVKGDNSYILVSMLMLTSVSTAHATVWFK